MAMRCNALEDYENDVERTSSQKSVTADQTKDVPVVVCLSSLFATDRIMLHSGFIDHLNTFAKPLVLSHAVSEANFPKDHRHSEYFESVPLDETFPHALTLLRHFESYAWDHTGRSDSRESFWRLRKKYESPLRERLLRSAAKGFSYLRKEAWLERRLEETIIKHGIKPSTLAWLRQVKPSLLITMYPFLEGQMVVVAAAKRLGIPVMAFITSWDNLTTKNRLIYQYDGYLVWSEHMKRELNKLYPQSVSRPVYVVGAPQYDVFTQQKFHQTREEFCRFYELDPKRPIILYCLGSPKMIREDYGAIEFVERASQDERLSRAQVIIRAHPGHLDKDLTRLKQIEDRYSNVVIQGLNRTWKKNPFEGEESISEWVNTIRHADVVVNLSSTISIDAAICDKPVVNLNFDPEPGSPNQQLVVEINGKWNHYKPVAASGGVWLVNNMEELISAVNFYLKDPGLHRAQRQWIVQHVCGDVDGLAGKRMAQAVTEVLQKHTGFDNTMTA